MIALTFDDGPHPKNTRRLLNLLKRRNILATFFVLGENAVLFPEILRELVEAGHEIGNHGWGHIAFDTLADSELMHELRATHEAVFSLSNFTCSVMRPPYGRILARQRVKVSEELQYRTVLWNVDSQDWTKPNPEKLVNNVLSICKEGSVVLFHDFAPVTVECLDYLLDALETRGYKFCTSSELIRELLV